MNYNSEKNPFYVDDEDDFAFSQPVNREYGNSKNSFDDNFGGGPLTKFEQLQQRKENSMNNQLESTQRALASICDSEQMGIATAEELVQQGEQLDNVETKLDTINRDMKTSQKHLNSIKSVFGGIKNWWQGKDKPSGEPLPAQKTKSESASGLQKALDESVNAGAHSGTHPAFRLKTDDGSGFYKDDDLDDKFLGAGTRRYDQPERNTRTVDNVSRTAAPPQQKQAFNSGFGAADEKFDENLDLMCSGMTRLKGLASGLGQEIDSQNVQIDRITGKSDRADIKLSDQNRQMRKILR